MPFIHHTCSSHYIHFSFPYMHTPLYDCIQLDHSFFPTTVFGNFLTSQPFLLLQLFHYLQLSPFPFFFISLLVGIVGFPHPQLLTSSPFLYLALPHLPCTHLPFPPSPPHTTPHTPHTLLYHLPGEGRRRRGSCPHLPACKTRLFCVSPRCGPQTLAVCQACHLA